MADPGPSDPKDAPRESLQEAREAAEETVQKLDELEERLDQGPSVDSPLPSYPPSQDSGWDSDLVAGDTDRDGRADYDAPQAPREAIDISRLDTGHPDGGPE